MDPSEFEGTIERQGDALQAGALELLLNYTEPTFAPMDLSTEVSDVCLSIFSLKETVGKFKSLSLSDLCLTMDDEAVQLAEMKEDYVIRRKTLTAKVKKFLTQFTSETATADTSVSDCKDIIESFKVEFDFLAQLSRVSETGFMSLYKVVREIPDLMRILSESLEACQKSHEVLKKAQEQLQLAAQTISEKTAEGAGSNGHVASMQRVAELENLRQQLEREAEALKQRHLSDVLGIKTRHERELRDLEHEVKGACERQQLDMQAHFDAALAKKDLEMAAVLRSLQESSQASMEAAERAKVLDQEMGRRRELEDRLRAALSAVAALESANAALTAREEAGRSAASAREEKSSAELSALRAESEQTARDLEALRARLIAAETDLARQPPVDTVLLAERLGLSMDRSSGQHSSWMDVERVLSDALRQANSEATACRIREQEMDKQLTALREASAGLARQLAEKTSLAAALERDLHSAHSALQSNRALVNSLGGHRGAKNLLGPATTTTAAAVVVEGKGESVASLEDLLGTPDEPSFRSEAEQTAVAAAASAMTDAHSSSAQEGSGDRIMLAVQSQRDRFMRACREKDGELSDATALLDRLQAEAAQLRSDNLELYRRLRVLRANAPSSSGRTALSRRGHGSMPFDVERGVGGNNSADDDEEKETLQSKTSAAGEFDEGRYESLYEAHISPFKVEELDRQAAVSRLNPLERALVFVNRQVIQDRWSRHALIVYLLIVHAFALTYVFGVLNPQLAEEVDSHLQARWSAETMAAVEHPDI